MNVDRAHGRADLSKLVNVLYPTDVKEMQQAMRIELKPSNRGSLRKELMEYGEKCKSMSDENCESCLIDNEFICLRSLVGRYLKDTLILAHKGIELSDIQGTVTVGDDELSIFGFAKLPVISDN